MEENQKDMPAVQETPEAPQSEFVPSPKWKRVLAWVLFAIVVLGIASWLLNIAVPEWPEKLFGYTRGCPGYATTGFGLIRAERGPMPCCATARSRPRRGCRSRSG